MVGYNFKVTSPGVNARVICCGINTTPQSPPRPSLVLAEGGNFVRIIPENRGGPLYIKNEVQARH